MKKFLPWIIAVLILSGIAAYFVFYYIPSTIEKKQSDFSFKATDKITRIKLSDQSGKVLWVKKDLNGKWIVNDKYPASDEALGLLFTALERINTVGPVPVNGIENVLRDLLQKHFKIEIFTDDNKAEKVFYVGGPTQDNRGTFMLMEVDGTPAPQPYITHIPGIHAYLTARFNNDSIHWRSRWVYPFKAEQIQTIEVNYLQDSLKSFGIKKVSRDSFVLINSKGEITEQPKQSYIHQYIGFYPSISIEAFKNRDPKKDSILRQKPFATVRVTTTDKKSQEAIVYLAPITESSRVLFDDYSRPQKYDVEYYYIEYNNREDFAVVQYYVWGKILRSYQDFFFKPSPKKQPQRKL